MSRKLVVIVMLAWLWLTAYLSVTPIWKHPDGRGAAAEYVERAGRAMLMERGFQEEYHISWERLAFFGSPILFVGLPLLIRKRQVEEPRAATVAYPESGV